MGLSYTGSSCLLMASVAGCSRVPEPPARMMPLRVFMAYKLLQREACLSGAVLLADLTGEMPPSSETGRSQHRTQHASDPVFPGRLAQPELRAQLATVQARIQ